MAKAKTVLRAFFNTYYEDVARKIIEKLKELAKTVRVSRSRVVPELYFVEIDVGGQDDLEKLRETVENILKSDDRVFGAKVYIVKT